jgi:hypothetical protein
VRDTAIETKYDYLHCVTFSTILTARWASIEESVAFKDLPVEAQQLIQTKYAKAVVSRAERVTEGDKVEYEVSARQGKKKISLVFDSDGKLLKSTAP